jgi:hypothetical protein
VVPCVLTSAGIVSLQIEQGIGERGAELAAPRSERSFSKWIRSCIRVIPSLLGIVQKLWMKNVVANRNTASRIADRSAHAPRMIPSPPRRIMKPLRSTAAPGIGIFFAAA